MQTTWCLHRSSLTRLRFPRKSIILRNHLNSNTSAVMRKVATSLQKRSRRQAFEFVKKDTIYTERSYIYTESDNTRQTFVCPLRIPQDGITEHHDVSKGCKQACLDM